MNDLDMRKAIAELEGVDCQDRFGELYTSNNGYELVKYNPITDLALNCMASDKYNVGTEFVSPRLMYVSICEYYENEKHSTVSVKVNSKDELPRARIECILKSKGKL